MNRFSPLSHSPTSTVAASHQVLWRPGKGWVCGVHDQHASRSSPDMYQAEDSSRDRAKEGKLV